MKIKISQAVVLAITLMTTFICQVSAQDWEKKKFDRIPERTFRVVGPDATEVDSAHEFRTVTANDLSILKSLPGVDLKLAQWDSKSTSKKSANAAKKFNYERLEIKDVVTIKSPNVDHVEINAAVIVFQPGGRLNIPANKTVTINVQDIFIQSKRNPGKILVYGSRKAKDGRKGSSGEPGKTGKPAGHGGHATNGTPGYDAPQLTINALRCDNDYALDIWVLPSNGGAGGVGGTGGKGAPGKAGRDSESFLGFCSKGCRNGERGQRSGNGGNGGDGGDGGDAGQVNLIGPVKFLAAVRNFRITLPVGKGGTGGKGGLGPWGGVGGAAGKKVSNCDYCSKGPIGFPGKDGERGLDGSAGRKGNIYHIPRP